MDNLLRKILDLIEKNNLTDLQFQKDLGLYKTAVAEWKNGKSKSYQKHLPKIADYFGVSVDYLLGKTDQKEKPLIDADEEIAEYVKALKDRPELRTVIDVTKNAPPSDVEKVLRVVTAMLDTGDMSPENTKIAAFSGYAKPPKDSEADRAAEIERLTKRIRELENGSDS